MARAQGANSQLLAKKETSYGTAPSGNYTKMPFRPPFTLSQQQGLITDPVLGQGREGYPPQLDTITVDGGSSVPVDLRYIGHWLTMAFGAPVSSDETTHKEHVWKSGAASLPSYTLERGLPEIPSFSKFVGVMLDSIGFNFQRSGFAAAGLELVAQGEEDATSSTGGGTPTELTYTPFSQFRGAIKSDGSFLANVVSGSLRYSNNLDRVETIRSDGKIQGLDPTQATVSGTIVVRLADYDLMDAARAGDPIDLEFSYEISATEKLVMTVHEVYLPVPRVEIPGPGGIEQTYDWQAAKKVSEGCALTVTLLNDVGLTVY